MRLGMQLLREGGSFDYPRNRALVLFTDGEPDDARKLSLAQYFAELSQFIEEQVKPAKVDVFVVGIDAAGKRWSRTVSYWQNLVGGDHVFTTPNMPALKSYFNRIVQRIWHLPEVESVVVSTKSPVEFDLEPYLDRVEFHIFPSRRGLTLNVIRPDGKIVEPGKDPDTPPVKHLSTFDLLVVHDPEPGRWRYEVVGGEGSVEVLRNPIPLRMRLISPAPVHPQGKPMRLIAEFKRSDGKPVPSYRDYPLALTADIITPSGKRTQVKFPLERGRNGVYVGEPTLEAPMEVGEYQVVLKVSGGEKYHSDYVARVEVKPIPYLLVDEPAEGKPLPPTQSLSVRVRLLQAGKPINPQDAFTNHPDYLVIAQVVESPRGQRGQAVWLNLAKEAETPGQFAGNVAVPELQEGRYVLAVRLAPEEKEKQAIADQSIITFTMQYPPPPLWKRALLWCVIVLVLIVPVMLFWRKHNIAKLRLTVYYWIHDQSKPDSVMFKRQDESRDLVNLPIKITRIGKSNRVKLSPAQGAVLMRHDGQEVNEVEVTEPGVLVYVRRGESTKAVFVTLRTPPAQRPPSPDQIQAIPEEGPTEDTSKGLSLTEDEFDWGYRKEGG